MNSEAKRLVSYLKKYHLDAFLVTNDINIFYLTGYQAQESWLLVCRGKLFYLTDSRYASEVKKHLKGVIVQQYTKTLAKELFILAKDLKLKKIAIDERHLSLAAFKKIKREARGIKFIAKNVK